MESVANKKPCRTCGKNLNIGDPFRMQKECQGCIEYSEFMVQCEIRLAEIEYILGDEYSLEKLKEMVDAEKDGRCVVLPVKINSCVWFIKSAFSMAHFPIKANHVSFRGLSTDGDIWYSAITENNGISRSFYGSDLNKTVFLTREEAEKALEGMEV